jgi:Zn-dependent protease with chaperone function
MPPANPQDAVAAARQFLPAWVVWGNDLLFVATSLFVTFSGTWIATRIAFAPLQAAAPDSWVERACLAYPARQIVLLAGVIFPTVIMTWAVSMSSQLSPIPRAWLGVLPALVTILLILAFRCRVERLCGAEPISFLRAVRSLATWLVIVLPHAAVALAVLPAMPDEFNWRAGFLLVATGGLACLFAAGGNLRIARFLALAHPASPRLGEIVNRTAARVGATVRSVYEIDWAVVNALAIPLTNSVAFTRRAIDYLSDEELEYVCAHELGHLLEPRRIRLIRLAVVIATAAFLPAIVPIVASGGLTTLAASFVLYLLVLTIFTLFARRMERRADTAAAASGSDPAVYARTLEKLYRLNLAPAVTGKKLQCHPELYDRLVAAGVQPEYPRPERPSRGCMAVSLAALILPISMAVALAATIISSIIVPGPRAEWKQNSGLVCGIDDAYFLHNLGWLRFENGQLEAAVTLLKGAVALSREDWEYPLNLGNILSYLDRCDEARAALQEAKARLEADSSVTDKERAVLEKALEGLEGCYERSQQRQPLPQPDAVAAVVPDERPS